MELELVMPKYSVRGGSVVLKCVHDVPPEQLYKVEWQRGGTKIFQYIKGRVPPFRYFPSTGFQLNKENSSDKQIQLSKLDFSASGSYSCVVSMETPIFSKDSESHVLTVIEPQEREPLITFNKNTYEIGEILEANCTAGPSRPPPYITWFINDIKVFDSLTRSFTPSRSTNTSVGIGYFEQRATCTKQLSVEVSELHVGDNGQLWLTCLATIPGYVGRGEEYADRRNHSVRIVVEMQEEPAEPILNNNSQIKQINDIFIIPVTLTLVILTSN